MSSFLMDSDAISRLLREEPRITARFADVVRASERVMLSPVVDYEVRRGLLRKGATLIAERYARLSLALGYTDFRRQTWIRAAELWAYTQTAGLPLPDADILIAAQAMVLEATLVTSNVRHFQRFQPFGLVIEDWAAD